MPIDFPSSPTTGQVYTYLGKSWVYNGTGWDAPRALSEIGAVRTFANATARNAAIPSPTEGIVAYLNDVDSLETYNGTSWVSSVMKESNISLGIGTLSAITTGVQNVAIGSGALQANTSANNNTAVGRNALNVSTTGGNNTAIGRSCLQANTTGSSNTAVGVSAMLAGTTATSNTAVGFGALEDNETGNNNVAIGQGALANHTTNNNNTAVGTLALRDNTTGSTNTAVGNNALRANTTGVENLALGDGALIISTSNQNVAVGRRAGELLTTGANNVMLGYNAQAAAVNSGNSITLGNSSVTSLRCQITTISSLSDKRDKKDIKDLDYGLDLINKVRPVEFTWDTRDGSIVGRPDIGFIAQELAEVEDNLNDTDRLKLTLRDNPEKLEATPGRLLPIAIKAIQELSAQNADLLARLEKLENK